MANSKEAIRNNGLYRLHRFLLIVDISFIVIFAILGAKAFFGPHSEDAGLGFAGIVILPFVVIHYYAAIGARSGKPWGRSLSRFIAAIMLLGIPVGTMIGIFILNRTGKKWQEESKT